MISYIIHLHFTTVYDGDSGAWVVHNAAPELYGHVTATDLFGSAYVVPALDAFDNIRDCLGAVSVTLPVTGDLAQAEANRSHKVDDEICAQTRVTPDALKSGAKSEASFSTPQAIPITPAYSSEVPSQKHTKKRGFAGKRWSTSDTWLERLVSKDDRDPIKLFMSGYEADLPPREDDEVRAVIDFCKTSTSPGVGEGRAWLDDQEDFPDSINAHRPYRQYLTASQLREHLMAKESKLTLYH
jgi:hypothetical protein